MCVKCFTTFIFTVQTNMHTHTHMAVSGSSVFQAVIILALIARWLVCWLVVHLLGKIVWVVLSMLDCIWLEGIV